MLSHAEKHCSDRGHQADDKDKQTTCAEEGEGGGVEAGVDEDGDLDITRRYGC